MKAPACQRCGQLIGHGQFYIEARRCEGKRYIAQRPGVDNGVNYDPIVYIHVPTCDVY